MISGLAYNSSQGKADELSTRNKLEEQTVDINEKAIESQLAVQQAKVAQAQAIYDLKRQQLDALKVRAGISGVLTSMPLAVGPACHHGHDAGGGGATQSAESPAEDR